MEAEVVSMVVGLFNGHSIGACGSMTSGGTESIIMSLRAHKEWAREVKGITRPHVVLPFTAHCAFDKGCEYFGIRVTHVPVNPSTWHVDLKNMRNAICRNTIMIVGSCPSFPWGLIDDIEGLSQIALDYNIGLHVDCCLGSFLVAFMERAGFQLPKFDFRLPGVTAISCDTHKYGFAPKGSSIIMYRSPELRRFQYFSQPNWPGGVYASPTMAGSRPGQLVAGCWGSLMYHGKDGYTESCKKIIGTARKIISEVKKQIPSGITVVGNPLVSVVAFHSKMVNIYIVSEKMSKRGWNLNNLQSPPSFHVCCTLLTDADVFIQDLVAVMTEVLANPSQEATGSAVVYGLSSSLPDRSIVDRIARGYVDTLYHLDKPKQ
eukprot:TRINITY_DN2720_c0_g2_i9.p1 TRINITY_DN2720_c0_g2~~TRINITY_DN2720_c0_g2_i9.p1  ORF type:complete len:375 (+),score=65.93 TRINITY_DN2720_c0_g2_i9:622-1746(+)